MVIVPIPDILVFLSIIIPVIIKIRPEVKHRPALLTFLKISGKNRFKQRFYPLKSNRRAITFKVQKNKFQKILAF